MASNQRFSVDLSAYARRAKGNMHSIVRKTLLDLGTSLVEMSPVGDRERWAANEIVLLKRETYQVFLESQGKKRVTANTLKRKFPTSGPKGYVGGRFRANWQLGEGAPVTGELYSKDDASFPGPSEILANIDAAITLNPGGKVFFFCNNLPYAQRLEGGWSSQAPAGMVGITAMKFRAIVEDAAAEVRG